jgi:hypothetical protein
MIYSFQQGVWPTPAYAGCTMNSMLEGSPNENQIGTAYPYCSYLASKMTGSYDANHILLKFDLSTIPVGTVVTGVTLRLYQFNTFTYTNDNFFNIYESRRAWTMYGSTWNKWDGTNNLTTPGGTPERL